MTGETLNTFITGLNADSTIDSTMLNVLINTAKLIIEEERPWMVLRKTNTAITLTGSETWQTAKTLSGITDFSRFYGEFPIRLFDGNGMIEYYRQVPFDRRLEHKDGSGTFCFDENAGIVYFNGIPPFAGTLYINYIATTPDIDVDSEDTIWSPFARFAPLLGFYAVGIHKGAVDWDTINQQTLPENRAVMLSLKNAMEKWDTERQLSSIEGNDPTSLYSYSRNGSIDIHNE